MKKKAGRIELRRSDGEPLSAHHLRRAESLIPLLGDRRVLYFPVNGSGFDDRPLDVPHVAMQWNEALVDEQEVPGTSLLEVSAIGENHLAVTVHREAMRRWLRAVARQGSSGRIPEEIGWAIALRDPLLTLGRNADAVRGWLGDTRRPSRTREQRAELREATAREIFAVWIEGKLEQAEINFRVEVAGEEVDAQVAGSVLGELEKFLDRMRLRRALETELAWDRPVDARPVH